MSASLNQAFTDAVMVYERGDLKEAGRRLMAIQRQRPDLPDVLHLLAIIALRGGKFGDAAGHLERAVDGAPNSAELHDLLGGAYWKLDRPADALAAYRRAVALAPDAADSHYNLANVLKAEGRTEEAVQHYRIAAELRPDFADAHFNLGVLLLQIRRAEEAVAALKHATRLNPRDAEALGALGDAQAEINANDESLDIYDRAIRLQPDFVRAHFSRGRLLARLGRDAEAIDAFRRAISIAPGNADAYTDLGKALHQAGRFEEALDCYRRAMAIDPGLAMAHHNLAQTLLTIGQFAEGWSEFEWRWRIGADERRSNFPQRQWAGEPLAGKTILVGAEQGVGDEVLYASMVPDLIERGARVVLESDPRLIPLFRRSFPGVTCVAKEEPPAAATLSRDINFQAVAGDLGRWLRADLGSFPGRPSYLIADEPRRGALRATYGKEGGGLLVGISWVSKNVKIGPKKSMTLAELAPLATVPGVTLIDLQYGDTAAERAAFEKRTGAAIIHDPGVDQMADLDAFAAQVAALDLVVSVSNTTVHIAGALGIPTWVMLNTVPLNCWLIGRDDSPWYPSVRLFRQTRAGEWSDVVERIRVALLEFASCPRSPDS